MDTQVLTPARNAAPKSTVPEPSPIPIFNRTDGVLGYSFPEWKGLDLEPGRWTTHYPLPPGIAGSPFAKNYPSRPIPRQMVTQYLQHDPNISTQILYRQFTPTDFKNITIAASYHNVTGWGRTNTAITRELIALREREQVGGIPESDVPRAQRKAWAYEPEYPNVDLTMFPVTHWSHTDLPDNVRQLMRKPHRPTPWSLAMTIPSELPNIPSRNIILMTMWETAHMPQEWIPHLARIRHLIVPSTHQVEVFKENYHGGISVVPLGVDPDAFTYRPRPQRTDEPFTILTYGSPLTSRKSPWEIIQEVCYRAFYGHAEPVDDWKLILKTHSNILGAGGFNLKISEPHVEVISGVYSNQELADLCYSADVGVFLSKFEGFGLCPLEAMSTGLPVILSQNTGHLDFCHPLYSYPVPTKRIIPAQEAYSGNEDWKWEEPDWEYAAAELRQQYDMWKLRGKTQSPVGELAAGYVRENFTWRKTAEGINQVLNTLVKI